MANSWNDTKWYSDILKSISTALNKLTLGTVNVATTETNSGAILVATQSIASALDNTAGALQVELVGSTGTPINITAGDINVQLSDRGTNPDATRIGDGTTLLAINTDGSINAVDAGCASGGHIANTSILAASATQISGTSHVCKKVFITAPYTNTGYITVGFSTVTLAMGVILNPGESVEFPVSNTNVLYAIAEVNLEDITVTYFN